MHPHHGTFIADLDFEQGHASEVFAEEELNGVGGRLLGGTGPPLGVADEARHAFVDGWVAKEKLPSACVINC